MLDHPTDTADTNVKDILIEDIKFKEKQIQQTLRKTVQ